MVSKTGIGIGNGIPFGNNSSGGDRPYLSPELKSRLRIVAYTYGKRNEDADRATIRNLVDPDNPLICHNFAWIPNSGYGFTTNYIVNPQRGDIEILGEQHWLVKSVTQEGTNRQCINIIASSANFAGYTFNIKCSGIKDTDNVTVRYGYAKYVQLKNGDNIVTYEAMPNDTDFYVFDFNKEVENIEIEVEPIMQDALVTDGVNDVIESTKTCGEMFADMGNETTISFISKFHLIDYSTSFNNTTFNNIRNDSNLTARNTLNRSRDVSRKDIIVGWTKSISNNSVLSYISGILGDKEDYTATSGGLSMQDDMKFFPLGYNTSTNTINELSKIAYEWTIGGIGTFTEDDINQIIAYYRLDRTIKADIYCNIEKQGITNENHNDFGNQLIDYSGNGRNIQMNNLGWIGGSGIAAKQGESIRDYSIIPDEGIQTLTIYNEFKYKIKSTMSSRYWGIQYINKTNTSYPITIVIDKDAFWVNSCTYYDVDNNKQVIRKEIAVLANTPTNVLCCGYDQFDIPEDATSITSAVSYIDYKTVGEITVEFIPSHKGAIILDGINDFGKVTRLPVYKDYTVAIEYERFKIGYIEGIGTATAISKSYLANKGAFLMNLIGSNGIITHSYSFGEVTINNFGDLARELYYQSKYKNQDLDIVAGTGDDSDSLWLGAVRDNDSRFFNGAIYSLMVFPYSMNKFLLDRQLKKYKAGTLYKDMVQLRPVVKADMSIGNYRFFDTNWNKINKLDYFPVGIQFWMVLYRIANETIKDIRVSGCKYIRRNYDAGRKYWNILLELTDKSPQKITLYMEADSTLTKFEPKITSDIEFQYIEIYYNGEVIYKPSASIDRTGIWLDNSKVLGIYVKPKVPNKVTNINYNGVDYTELEVNENGFYFTRVPINTSPQMINIVQEVDETLVQFNPIINSNIPYTIRNSYVIRDPVAWTQIKVGDYLSVGERIAIQLYFNEDKGDVYEITNYTCPQLDNINYTKTTSNTGWTIFGYLKKGQNTQNITIEIDEYIKFEDIVQPYPAFISLTNYNTKQVYTFGDKIKVNTYVTVSEITNLLTGLYSDVSCFLNGQRFFKNFNYYISKDDVFTSTKTWSKDNNEPTAWLSPRLLRMPNSSYKYLGYIPDITGHGNHGYIKNSVYSGMSGANAYNIDFNQYQFSNTTYVEKKTDSLIVLNNKTNTLASTYINIANVTKAVPAWKLKVTGLIDGAYVNYLYSEKDSYPDRTSKVIDTDGEYTLPASIANNNMDNKYVALSFSIPAGTKITIEQIGVHEGCFFLDGVDDSIEFSNSFINNSKQVILNTLWQTTLGLGILYDARNSENSFAIYNSGLAYLERNQKGNTYIDGIENKYINSSNLQDKTHVIVSTNNDSISNYPFIGCTRSHEFYTKMAIWDCVLFPEISTPAMITSHSKYVGIKPKIEIPMWYYDVHGKTNFDTYKTQITEQIGFQKNGTSGNYVANNRNFEYDEMSGYEGYSFANFTSSKWTNPNRENGIEVINKDRYSFTAKRVGTGQYFYDFNNRTITELNKELIVKAISDKAVYVRWEFKYRTAENPDVDSTLILVKQVMTPNVPITVTLPYKTEQEKTDLGVTEGSESYMFYFDPSNIPVDEEYTVTMLPLYPNGLVYDGVSDYTEQIKLPVLTDFTLLIKVLKLTGYIGSGGCIIRKGVFGEHENTAFIYALDSTNTDNQNTFWSFGSRNKFTEETPLIGYMTKLSCNGNAISTWNKPDTTGLIIGKWSAYSKIVFYKTIIYNKTVEQFWIDFLRNMMAREEIIDITYPIFIQDTGGG